MHKKILALAISALMLISVLSVIQLPLANAALTTTHLNLTTKKTAAEGVPIHTLPTDGTCRMLPNTPYWDNSSARGKLYPTDAVNNNTAYGSPFCVFLHPGVGDANKTGWSHTLDTLYGTQYALGYVAPVRPTREVQLRSSQASHSLMLRHVKCLTSILTMRSCPAHLTASETSRLTSKSSPRSLVFESMCHLSSSG